MISAVIIEGVTYPVAYNGYTYSRNKIWSKNTGRNDYGEMVGTIVRAAAELGRSAYGFEIDRNFYERAKNEMLVFKKDNQMSISDFIGDTV